MKKTARNIYLGFILFLMYAPIATLVVLSFNSSKSRSKWGGFTLKWYSSLFQDDAIMSALYNTLAIAFLSALIATIIGTCASLGITAMKAKWRTVIMGITNIPVLNSDIVTGISLMLLFIAFRFTLGFSTILIAHITFNIPYAILSVMPKLKQTNKSTYEAARDLGAGPFQSFMKVVFPDILPGVLSGFLMTFTMSLDDFIITHFTKGPGVDTLSTKIYSEVRKGIRPEMYALSTLLFLSVMVIMILMNTSPKETDSKKAGSTSKDFKRKRKIPWHQVIPAGFILLIAVTGLVHHVRTTGSVSEEQVIVYNWGEYIDPDVLDIFEEETGIHIRQQPELFILFTFSHHFSIDFCIRDTLPVSNCVPDQYIMRILLNHSYFFPAIFTTSGVQILFRVPDNDLFPRFELSKRFQFSSFAINQLSGLRSAVSLRNTGK